MRILRAFLPLEPKLPTCFPLISNSNVLRFLPESSILSLAAQFSMVPFCMFMAKTTLPSALLAFFLFIIGTFSADLKLFAATVGSGLVKVVCQALYYVLPNLANFNYITATAHGNTPSVSMVGAATMYAALYISALLAATVMIFQRRNFK